MNAKIRSGLVVLSLAIGVVQMARAATYDTPQQSLGSQRVRQGTKTAQSERTFTIEPSMAPIANDRASGNPIQMPNRLRALAGGNNYNWLAGGGG
jgi:hypothetical protein